jgi:SAM-dependent methyltransferase
VLGIGTGRELPALLDVGHEVQAIEVAPAMIALCNQRARRVPIHEGDFYDPLPFETERFDAVLALHGTLAHPPNDDALTKLAKEIARVLANDGVLVAEVPRAEALAEVAGAPPEGMRIEVTGPTTFVHHDDRVGARLAGVALDAEGWRAALAPALEANVGSLGPTEYFIVARRSR